MALSKQQKGKTQDTKGELAALKDEILGSMRKLKKGILKIKILDDAMIDGTAFGIQKSLTQTNQKAETALDLRVAGDSYASRGPGKNGKPER